MTQRVPNRQWNLIIDISDTITNKIISHVAMAKDIVSRIENIDKKYTMELRLSSSIALATALKRFKHIIANDIEDVEDFDEALDDLYDWGASVNVWVKTDNY